MSTWPWFDVRICANLPFVNTAQHSNGSKTVSGVTLFTTLYVCSWNKHSYSQSQLKTYWRACALHCTSYAIKSKSEPMNIIVSFKVDLDDCIFILITVVFAAESSFTFKSVVFLCWYVWRWGEVDRAKTNYHPKHITQTSETINIQCKYETIFYQIPKHLTFYGMVFPFCLPQAI